MLVIKNITKSYGAEQVLKGICATVPKGEVMSILGTSGSGKTTFLRCLAGLEAMDTGTLFWENTPLHPLSPQQRGIVYLYQEPLLFPHLSVSDNLGFGLKVRRWAKAKRQAKIDQLLNELGLEAHAHKKPHQLSGGQQQRVNFGRAIIIEPRVLLLDEPFGNLDTGTRQKMQQLFQRVARQHLITSIFVTHDIKESLLMGHQWAMLREGVLHHYADVKGFLADPATGAHAEIDFWTKLNNDA